MICGMTYFQICLYFLIYSFGGWVVEVIFPAVALGLPGIWIWGAFCFCFAQYNSGQRASDE